MQQCKVFKVGLVETSTSILNGFMRDNTIISVERQFVCDGQESFWALFLEYDSKSESGYDRKEKIDYGAELNPKQRACYDDVREYRNRVAKEQGVPAYAIMTNAMVATIAKIEQPTKAALKAIDGFGDAKTEKYADPILAIMVKHVNTAS